MLQTEEKGSLRVKYAVLQFSYLFAKHELTNKEERQVPPEKKFKKKTMNREHIMYCICNAVS